MFYTAVYARFYRSREHRLLLMATRDFPDRQNERTQPYY